MTRHLATFALSLTFALTLTACRPSPPSAADPQAQEPPMKVTVPPCRVTLEDQGAGRYGISFELANTSEHAIRLDTYQPFLQFQLRVHASSATLAVAQPALDLPVQPQTLAIPALTNQVLRTPLQLLIRPGATSQDGMVWAIDHEARGLVLEFTLDLPPPFNQPCTTELE